MRLFIAIDMPDLVKTQLQTLTLRLQQGLPGAVRNVRWTARTQFHLTLQFLGQCNEPTKARLIASLQEAIADTPPFTMNLEKLGCFPMKGRPQVIWIGLKTGASEVQALAATIDAVTARLGFKRDAHSFHPHITLGRISVGENPGLRTRLGGFPLPSIGPFVVEHLVLFESRLLPDGAAYVPQKNFYLRQGSME